MNLAVVGKILSAYYTLVGNISHLTFCCDYNRRYRTVTFVSLPVVGKVLAALRWISWPCSRRGHGTQAADAGIPPFTRCILSVVMYHMVGKTNLFGLNKDVSSGIRWVYGLGELGGAVLAVSRATIVAPMYTMLFVSRQTLGILA